jgi:hypothetical protein
MPQGGPAVFDGRAAPQYVRGVTADGDIYQAMMWQRHLRFIQYPEDVVTFNAMRHDIPQHLAHGLTKCCISDV